VGPYTFTLLSGTLPAGLTLSTTGTLSGTPTAVGTFTFTVQATSAGGSTGNQAYAVTVAAAAVTVSPATLPGGTDGAAYSQTRPATGRVGPYTFTLLSGALPAGLTLSTTGTLSGTPTAVGTFTFTVQATSAGGSTGSRAYSVAVGAAAVTVSPV